MALDSGALVTGCQWLAWASEDSNLPRPGDDLFRLGVCRRVNTAALQLWFNELSGPI
jgi:hypothetical protein